MTLSVLREQRLSPEDGGLEVAFFCCVGRSEKAKKELSVEKEFRSELENVEEKEEEQEDK